MYKGNIEINYHGKKEATVEFQIYPGHPSFVGNCPYCERKNIDVTKCEIVVETTIIDYKNFDSKTVKKVAESALRNLLENQKMICCDRESCMTKMLEYEEKKLDELHAEAL